MNETVTGQRHNGKQFTTFCLLNPLGGSVTFTDPELASVGLTEEAFRAEYGERGSIFTLDLAKVRTPKDKMGKSEQKEEKTREREKREQSRGIREKEQGCM